MSESSGREGDDVVRSMPGGGGRIIGDPDDLSGGGNGV